MNKLIAISVVLLLAIVSQGAKIIENGATSQSISVVINDENGEPNTTPITIADLDLYCQIDGVGAMSTKIDLVALASTETAWTSGRAIHLGQGLYRIDIPDANLSDGDEAMLTYIIDDGAGNNGTSFYEVQLSPKVAIVVNGIASTSITNGAITVLKIGVSAITADKIAPGAITDSELTATGTSLTAVPTLVWADANGVRVFEDANTAAINSDPNTFLDLDISDKQTTNTWGWLLNLLKNFSR